MATRVEIFQKYGIELARLRGERFASGEVTYGSLQFLEPDGATIDQIKEELADVMNWTELLFLKLCVLEEAPK
jgi:hypothetical protein